MSFTHRVCVDTNNGKHTSCGFSRDSLVDALAEAIEQASYYYFECGYLSPTFTIERVCCECDGEGRVEAKRRGAKKVCPECRGKESLVTVVSDVPFALHNNVVISA